MSVITKNQVHICDKGETNAVISLSRNYFIETHQSASKSLTKDQPKLILETGSHIGSLVSVELKRQCTRNRRTLAAFQILVRLMRKYQVIKCPFYQRQLVQSFSQVMRERKMKERVEFHPFHPTRT